ncbi:Protein kinase domain - like 10 [Theobroma cacao]|nr:Protein kinase domain - like 10 [Theobroma cacao]
MQILHFDIKPHNILLDKKFVQKILDFGLAKLYPIDESIVSLTIARGTLGYIAPKLFYKYLGGISYKADVYNFGMLLMEIVGKRKILNVSVEQSSQIYFPSWIYDQFDQGGEVDLGEVIDDEKKIVRKMMKPICHPSMSNALEMLQSEIGLLKMPSKHFLFSLKMSEDYVNKN